MRSSLAYYLIILYALALLKPALPVVQDFFNHTFREAAHKASVHEHNGHNHVDLETSQITNEQDDDGSLINQTDPVSVHLAVASIDELNTNCIISSKRNVFWSSQLILGTSDKNYPPPRV